MKIIDSYKTIGNISTGDYREKGSKFLATAYPFKELKQFDEILKALRVEHPKSRHHCYAYKIGIDENIFRINDDGEPSGSAGRPIMSQIKSYELTNILVVVTRYFGGTKLGVPGLINAYKTATNDAITSNQIITEYLYDYFSISFDYGLLGKTLDILKQLDIAIIEKDFGSGVHIKSGIRKSLSNSLLLRLKAKLANKSLEETASLKSIEGYSFTMMDSY